MPTPETYKISIYLDDRWRHALKPLARARGHRTINAYLNALLARDTMPAAPAQSHIIDS